MADITTEEQEFGSFLDELEAEGDAAVAAADHDDERAAKQTQAQRAKRDDDGVVTKAEYMADKFTASASEREKALYAIYSHGADTPEQIRRAIELAKTNAAEEAKLTDEKVDELASRKAQETLGAGPLAPGGPSRDMTPQEIYDAKREQAKKTGSSHSFYELYRDLPAEAEASAG